MMLIRTSTDRDIERRIRLGLPLPGYMRRPNVGFNRRGGRLRGGSTKKGDAFSPLDLSPDLFLVEDAGITLDGSDNVSQWADQSGNGNHFSQGTASARPAYNSSDANFGTPSLTFDGSDLLLGGDILDLPDAADMTTIAIGRTNSTGRQRWLSKQKGTTTGGWARGINNTSDVIVEDVDGDAVVLSEAGFGTGANHAHRVGYTDSSGTVESFIDGTSSGSASEALLTGDSKSNSLQCAVGARQDGNVFWDGELVMIFLAFRLLTSDEIQQFSDWASARYTGITAV